jgi:hypothetical protein
MGSGGKLPLSRPRRPEAVASRDRSVHVRKNLKESHQMNEVATTLSVEQKPTLLPNRSASFAGDGLSSQAHGAPGAGRNEPTLRRIAMTWRPDLPEPRPALVCEPGDPEPVPLEVLRQARDLCANFRLPPRQFRRRTAKGQQGSYHPASDIVAVNRDGADSGGLGGDDGYYVTLLHELLHATGHRRRLDRATTGDYSPAGDLLEEGTVLAAQRIVLRELGFPIEAIEWHTPGEGMPVDRKAASEAAAWILG